MFEYDMDVTKSHRSDSMNSADEHIYFTISELNASRHNERQRQSDADKVEQPASDWSKQRAACWQEYWRWCDLFSSTQPHDIVLSCDQYLKIQFYPKV